MILVMLVEYLKHLADIVEWSSNAGGCLLVNVMVAQISRKQLFCLYLLCWKGAPCLGEIGFMDHQSSQFSICLKHAMKTWHPSQTYHT